MPENPLLPNAELRKLYALVKRLASLDKTGRKSRSMSGTSGKQGSKIVPFSGAEAFLAGTAIHLRTGDILIGAPAEELGTALAASNAEQQPAFSSPTLPASAPRLLSSVAMATALLECGQGGLVLVHHTAGKDSPDWQSALKWAQDARLPFVLACSDPGGNATFSRNKDFKRDLVTWSSVRQACAKLKLPVLSVDGEDGVAVYRVMQECALRARAGGGPAVIWAMLPRQEGSAAARPPTEEPLGRLKHYLQSRKIGLKD